MRSRVPLVPESLLGYTSSCTVDSLWLNLGGSYVGESFRGRFSNTAVKMKDYWLYDWA